MSEEVAGVLETVDRSGIAGGDKESNVGVFLGGLGHIALMAVGVGNDEIASVLGKVDSRVVASLGLADVVLPDDLGVVVVVDAERRAGFLNALHVGKVITDALVVQKNNAYLEGGSVFLGFAFVGLLFFSAVLGNVRAEVASAGSLLIRVAGAKSKNEDQRKQKCNRFFHFFLHYLFLCFFIIAALCRNKPFSA